MAIFFKKYMKRGHLRIKSEGPTKPAGQKS